MPAKSRPLKCVCLNLLSFIRLYFIPDILKSRNCIVNLHTLSEESNVSGRWLIKRVSPSPYKVGQSQDLIEAWVFFFVSFNSCYSIFLSWLFTQLHCRIISLNGPNKSLFEEPASAAKHIKIYLVDLWAIFLIRISY